MTIDRRFLSRFTTWPDVARLILALKKSIPVSPVWSLYAPATQLSVALSSSITVMDTTNVKITAPAVGSSGVVVIEAMIYMEITTGDQVLGRMTAAGGSAVNSSIDGITNAVSGSNYYVPHTWIVSGLTPGTFPSWVLSLQFRTATGVGAFKAGGTGSTLRPPVTLKATTY